MSDSSRRPKPGKATTPRPDFPHWIHEDSGQWCKMLLGNHEYFETVADDPIGVAALEEWLWVKDHLLAGKPRPAQGVELPAIRDLCNAWLRSKMALLESGELAERTVEGYKGSVPFLLATLGKRRTVASLTVANFPKLRGRMSKAWGQSD